MVHKPLRASKGLGIPLLGLPNTPLATFTLMSPVQGRFYYCGPQTRELCLALLGNAARCHMWWGTVQVWTRWSALHYVDVYKECSPCCFTQSAFPSFSSRPPRSLVRLTPPLLAFLARHSFLVRRTHSSSISTIQTVHKFLFGPLRCAPRKSRRRAL